MQAGQSYCEWPSSPLFLCHITTSMFPEVVSSDWSRECRRALQYTRDAREHGPRCVQASW